MIDRSHLLDALRFLTIVPVPPSDTAADPDWLSKSLKYFPGVGIGVGLFSAAVWLFTGTIWSPAIAALLAVAASIVVTGALHEDGLADTVDGFGGGRTTEQRLAIMKDSRIGAYGAIALGFGIALRVAALAGLPEWSGAAALVASHAAARVTPAFVLARMVYVGDVTAMKVSYEQAPVRADEFRFALIVVFIAALPLACVVFYSCVVRVIARWSAGRRVRGLVTPPDRRLHRRRARRRRTGIRNRLPARRYGRHSIGQINGN